MEHDREQDEALVLILLSSFIISIKHIFYNDQRIKVHLFGKSNLLSKKRK